ncbi:UDP-N-acetylmuramoyl-L-alanyl-D-glutamate--2,6-diaminopimelate ligase [Virgibacillus halodenitrificans]|uniref:UDP-N-acetylmuramoyl-L-alanyl-D-glutamate--2, 6-diaminopimelate ligase n=1 Tax=Virgibacillus halodenitrificans TaxID=1482 RepID=UPI000EF53880|nr:UDP-N-acetylmuramoyl-L-alanyl-D-glutamate--2,6-diaminopimelate ligase [Virgibacillus halodenitrificans]WHX27076.1 UDP-N-acetylmuramoyl-L-alanyl-D-glutamate--2,6-diaminopimelate ligase [Virgibacillus halodenitrificans]
MKLKELLDVIPFYQKTQSVEEIEITNIEMDSRKVEEGNLFVCISGFTVDGHDYVKEAVKNGAITIIAEKEVKTTVPVIVVPDTSRVLSMLAVKFYGNPTGKLPLIGVTGTNGKTTVSYVLEKIFNEFQKKTGIIGTIQTKIGDSSYPVNNTTPDALHLQKTFHEMQKQNVEQVIMEVSSHALDQGRVYGCDFDIAIFTNLSQDHLDYHKNIDDYLRAKSLLFSQLGNSYLKQPQKYAVINEDDASSTLLKKSTAQHVITYGCKNESQVMAKNIKLNTFGTSFELQTPVGSISIQSNLIGMFNVYNMLAASAAAITSLIPLDTIKIALESISGVNGRFEPVNEGQNYSVVVDYAHTPDSLENVLQTAKEFANQKVFVVVGCGGDRDRTKRPLMAKIAVKYADLAIFTSDNPRTEDPKAILQDMTTGLEEENYKVIEQRKEAIQFAVKCAEEDDIILIAGKGHETYQQIGKVKYDFDDREVARKAIQDKENG